MSDKQGPAWYLYVAPLPVVRDSPYSAVLSTSKDLYGFMRSKLDLANLRLPANLHCFHDGDIYFEKNPDAWKTHTFAENAFLRSGINREPFSQGGRPSAGARFGGERERQENVSEKPSCFRPWKPQPGQIEPLSARLRYSSAERRAGSCIGGWSGVSSRSGQEAIMEILGHRGVIGPRGVGNTTWNRRHGGLPMLEPWI